jgi:hypothetical protein
MSNERSDRIAWFCDGGPMCLYCGKTFRFHWVARWHGKRCQRHRT